MECSTTIYTYHIYNHHHVHHKSSQEKKSYKFKKMDFLPARQMCAISTSQGVHTMAGRQSQIVTKGHATILKGVRFKLTVATYPS